MAHYVHIWYRSRPVAVPGITTNTAAAVPRCGPPQPARLSCCHCSLAEELPRLLVECGALLHGYEALHSELLAGLHDSRGPLADPRCIALLCECGLLPAHDLARLA